MNTKLLKFVVAALLLTLAACGKKDANEARVSQGPGKTIEIKDKDGKIAVVASAKGIALPDDFPKDMPVMKDAVVTMVVAAGDNRMIMLSSGAPVADVLAFYQENLKTQGWKIDASQTSPESANIFVSKAGGQAHVAIAKNGKDTAIQLTVPKGKP